ncbi:hypothetical protein HMI54_009611 [Coelomomyces lativittatus]|nr:hypothetical protein HMI54_009611 [Coelomomyces lativittatus]KAJ1511155.1 hypothetical protein HMI56_005738 [Coelomomyces lativittatus]KAJ1512759.1 hypothetical protein HMI55_006121 [Coelomomyces lativittatus]
MTLENLINHTRFQKAKEEVVVVSSTKTNIGISKENEISREEQGKKKLTLKKNEVDVLDPLENQEKGKQKVDREAFKLGLLNWVKEYGIAVKLAKEPILILPEDWNNLEEFEVKVIGEECGTTPTPLWNVHQSN